MPNTNLRADRFSGYVTGTTVAVDGGIGRYNWIPRPWPRLAALLAAPVLAPSASPRGPARRACANLAAAHGGCAARPAPL